MRLGGYPLDTVLGGQSATHRSEVGGKVSPQAGFHDQQAQAVMPEGRDSRDEEHEQEPEPGADEVELILRLGIIFQPVDVALEHHHQHFLFFSHLRIF